MANYFKGYLIRRRMIARKWKSNSHDSPVIRQKGESQKRETRNQSTPDFPKNKHFLPPDTHTYVCVSECKKYWFFEKFGVFCFLVTTVLRFAHLPYNRRIRAVQSVPLCVMIFLRVAHFLFKYHWP